MASKTVFIESCEDQRPWLSDLRQELLNRGCLVISQVYDFKRIPPPDLVIIGGGVAANRIGYILQELRGKCGCLVFATYYPKSRLARELKTKGVAIIKRPCEIKDLVKRALSLVGE